MKFLKFHPSPKEFIFSATSGLSKIEEVEINGKMKQKETILHLTILNITPEVLESVFSLKIDKAFMLNKVLKSNQNVDEDELLNPLDSDAN